MYVTLIIIIMECVGHGHIHALHIFPIMPPPAGFMFILALNVIAIRSLTATAAASSQSMASAGEEEEEEVAHNRSAAEQEAAVNMKLRKVA